MELLKTDGVSALSKAKDRSDQFGHQSDQISAISRDARAQAEKLEAQAAFNKQIALEANENAMKAYELAKNTITHQKNIRWVEVQRGATESISIYIIIVQMFLLVMSFVATSAVRLVSPKTN